MLPGREVYDPRIWSLCSLEEEFMISGLEVYPSWIRSSGSKDWKFMIQEEKFMHYAPKIRSLCSKSENDNHLSLAEARAGLSLAIMSKILAS